MKKAIHIVMTMTVMLCFSKTSLSYESNTISLHKTNFIQNVQASQEDYTQAQFSLKFRPFTYEAHKIFIGYTNTFWWMTKEKSNEIRETNYNVEIFYETGSGRTRKSGTTVTPLRFGVDHVSNGEKGEDSRGSNSVFVQRGLIRGERFRLGGDVRVFAYITNSIKNDDIQNFTGNATYQIYTALFSRDLKQQLVRLSYEFQLGNNRSLSKGRQAVTFELGLLQSHLNFTLFAKFEEGFGTQGITNYNQKNRSVIFGISIK